MRNLRALALWGMGVVPAMALGACAAEMQEPSSTDSGVASGDLTSDSGSESTSTSASTSASTSTTTTTTSGNPSSVTTASVTTAGVSSSTETSSSVTTGSQPLGGTITSSSTSSSTSGSSSTTAVTVTGSGSTTSGSTTSSGTTSGGTTLGFGGGGNVSQAATANTTTGGGSCETTPATAPVPLEATDGWVDCSTNDIGIQGTFFTYDDGNGSTITPSFSGDEICVDGTAGQIVGGDNATWGAGLGVNLNQDDPEGDVNTWNADAMGISGFRFNLSAMPPGTGLRLVYQNGGTDYCVDVTAAGLQTVLFTDTAEECWSAGGGPPSGTMLEAVKWQVTTNATSDHDFSFCISGLAAIP